MFRFDVLTLFPEIFSGFLTESLIGRAIEGNLLEVELINFREYGLGRHKQVDDEPYGGGPGMVLRVEPIARALEVRREHHKSRNTEARTVLLSPQGTPFVQETARGWSRCDEALILICGRYEGFDERIRSLVDEEISGGDFVCLGGEVVAMTVIETVSRLIPGMLGNPNSPGRESFSGTLLEYPQYTRPVEFQGMKVPEALLSGNHGQIEEWRQTQALQRTRERRPDLATRSSE